MDDNIQIINSEPLRDSRNTTKLIDNNFEALIRKLAFIILIIWNISPIAAAVIGKLWQLINNYHPLYQLFFLTDAWYIILLITGFTGCLLGINRFLKSIQNAKVNNITKKQYVTDNLIPLFLFIMLVWSIISFLYAPYPFTYLIGAPFRRDGILSNIAYFGMFCCAYILSDKRLVTLILKLYTWIAVILSLLILINVDAINKILCLTPGSASFTNINHFAYYCCMAVMSSLYLFETEEKPLNKIVSIFKFAIISAALVYNSSLGPFLAAIAALIASLILAIWLDKKRIKSVLTGIIIFFMVTLFINSFNGILFADLNVLGLDFMNIMIGEGYDIAGSGRWILWKNSLQMISYWPILGCGPGHYSDLSNYLFNSLMRPHNEILEYAASIGLPGLFLYLAALYAYAKECIIKRKQVSSLIVGLTCIIIAYLVSSLFGVTMYYTSPFFFMFFGMSSKMLRAVEKQDNDITE